MTGKQRKAIIGIGSNAVRMLVADEPQNGSSDIIDAVRFREDVRPFAGLTAQGLSREAMERIALALTRLASRAKELGVTQAGLVATSAVRDAANADEFAEYILARTRLSMRVLSGAEEARLGYIGCASSDTDGIIDIGGGSTEIAAQNGGGLDTVSLQVGAVRLSRDLNAGDTASSIRAHMESALSKVSIHFKRGSSAHWVGVGGTFTTLARIDANGLKQVEGRILTFNSIQRISDILETMTLAERECVPGLPSKRADVIIPGAWIALGCMKALEIPWLTISERSNLYGVMISPPPGMALCPI